MPTTRRRATTPEPTVDLSYIEESLRQFAVPIDSLTPDPENPRIHNQLNMEAIVASLREFGQTIPIVVQREGMIVRVGNGRLEAAQTLGWTHIAAIVTDKPEAVMKAFGIADNRTAELALWNNTELAKLLDEIQESVPDLINSVGFETWEIENLINQYGQQELPDSGLTHGASMWTGRAVGNHSPEATSVPVPETAPANITMGASVRYVNLTFPADEHANFVELVRFFSGRYQTSITADAILKALTEFKESIQE